MHDAKMSPCLLKLLGNFRGSRSRFNDRSDCKSGKKICRCSGIYRFLKSDDVTIWRYLLKTSTLEQYDMKEILPIKVLKKVRTLQLAPVEK
jgi:hypothetical protein